VMHPGPAFRTPHPLAPVPPQYLLPITPRGSV
jgi:hypothetical protein